MAPLRRDFRQRLQSEAAPGESRVRKNWIASAPHHTPEVQDVHVDLARSAGEGAAATAAAFDLLDGSEQGLGRAGPADFGDGVPEFPLSGVTDRIGAVKRRDGVYRRETFDFRKGGSQMGPAVADIGAKAEVGDARTRREPVSTPLLRDGRSGLPRPLRTRPRPHPLLLPWPEPPRRTHSGSLRGSAP
jgi:hypothetical protein